MIRQFLQISIMALCGVLILGSANAAEPTFKTWDQKVINDVFRERCVQDIIPRTMDTGCQNMHKMGGEIPNCRTNETIVEQIADKCHEDINRLPSLCHDIEFQGKGQFNTGILNQMARGGCAAYAKSLDTQCTAEGKPKAYCKGWTFMHFTECVAFAQSLPESCMVVPIFLINKIGVLKGKSEEMTTELMKLTCDNKSSEVLKYVNMETCRAKVNTMGPQMWAKHLEGEIFVQCESVADMGIDPAVQTVEGQIDAMNALCTKTLNEQREKNCGNLKDEELNNCLAKAIIIEQQCHLEANNLVNDCVVLQDN